MWSQWKFTDDTRTVVSRQHENGKQESCLVTVLDDGITPDEPDAPPVPSVEEMIKADMRAAYTDDEYKEAYFEKHYESRPEKMDALQQRRIIVKARHAKSRE
jgi:hypothetical protein